MVISTSLTVKPGFSRTCPHSWVARVLCTLKCMERDTTEELVLSLRSYWCHSNHGIAHASDKTIIRFASTNNVHKHCAQCARHLNSNFSLTLAYLNLLAVNNQALENIFILFLTGGLFFLSWTLAPTQLTSHVTLPSDIWYWIHLFPLKNESTSVYLTSMHFTLI